MIRSPRTATVARAQPRLRGVSWARTWAVLVAVGAVGLVVLLTLPTQAHAGGKQRSIPDLRRDTAAWSEPMRGRGMVELALTIHIASTEGDPIASQTRIRRWVRRANRELAAAGIQVAIREVRVLPEGLGSVTRWRHRRALAHFAPRDGTIHVFVIHELDTQRRRLFHRRIRGLHWRYWGLNRKLRAREYIVVTRDAPTTTFAHELGHLFGLRHSSRDDNIMCSCRRGTQVSFSDAQTQEMREGLRSFSTRQADPASPQRADTARPPQVLRTGFGSPR